MPCRRDAHSKRAIHDRAIVQRTVFSATVPPLAIHVALDHLRHHLCGAATRLVDNLISSTLNQNAPLVIRSCLSNTHRFLPIRNGLVPNTAHVMFHLATAATLFILLAR